MQVSRRMLMATAGTVAATIVSSNKVAAEGTPVASPAPSTRTVVHAMGNSEVPADPQRLVALDGPVLDAAIRLGITPVGATTGVESDPFPAYLGDAVRDIRNVGTIVEPNLELIVELKPDLIIGVRSRHEAIYEQLSQIAPTVFVEEHRFRWKENFALIAETLNRAGEIPEVESSYRQRCESLGIDLQLAESPVTASVLRVYTDIIYAYQAGSFSGSVLADVGFARPDAQSDPAELAIELSPEQIILGDGDVIFLAVWGDPETTDVGTLVDNPLWPSLHAVQTDRVYLVSDEYWMVAMGYLAADKVLDDIRAYLVDDEAPPPLPAA